DLPPQRSSSPLPGLIWPSRRSTAKDYIVSSAPVLPDGLLLPIATVVCKYFSQPRQLTSVFLCHDLRAASRQTSGIDLQSKLRESPPQWREWTVARYSDEPRNKEMGEIRAPDSCHAEGCSGKGRG